MITAPVKPMKPMDIEFNDDKDRAKFVNWAESNEKDKSENMNRIRDDFKRIRAMRKKGF